MVSPKLFTEPDKQRQMSVDDHLGRRLAEQAAPGRAHELQLVLHRGGHRFDRDLERLRVHATLPTGSRPCVWRRAEVVVSGRGGEMRICTQSARSAIRYRGIRKTVGVCSRAK